MLPTVRTLFILGRVSNLPTVWANVTVGYCLSGAPLATAQFWRWQIAASLFYTAGMYWNDAFDAKWDRANAPERPIPSGAIKEFHVWLLGAIQWALAVALLWSPHAITWAFAVALTLAILLYDALHKKISWAPWIMATCRVLLIALAATSMGTAPTASSLLAALGTGGYIVGLTYIARRERTAGVGSLWPLLFLSAPLVLRLAASPSPWSALPVIAVLGFCAWTFWMVRPLLFDDRPHIGKAVGGLLAGLPLVDAIAVSNGSVLVVGVMGLLFLACLLLQRWIPAT